MIKKHLWWLLPVLAMALITPFTPALDMDLASYFYTPVVGGKGEFVDHGFYNFMYFYGVIPGEAAGLLAFIMFVLTYFLPKWKKWRPAALVLLLTMVLGAGFIVHTLLKDQWGRPRPKQVEQFGGIQSFRPYYKPNFFHQPEPSKSFPCGHCTMGFYFFAFALVFKRLGKTAWFYCALAFALLLGAALGITRMAQGGHFFSDVLMTALIMWLVAYTCDWLVFENNQKVRR